MFAVSVIEAFEGAIHHITFNETKTLLNVVRGKCPHAVIVLFGYFLPISYKSKYQQMKDYFEFENDNAVAWYLDELLDIKDIDGMIHAARVRTVWAHALSRYRLRRAVLNLDRKTEAPG